MKIEATLTGLDDLKETINSNIKESLTEAGEESIKYAKKHGTYKNHTFNLRSAPGYGVVMNGSLKAKNVIGDGHAEAKAKTEATIAKNVFPGIGLIVADGMPYASYVEAKGYDVVGSGALKIDKILNEKTRG